MIFQLRLRNNQLISLPKPAIMGIVNCSPNSFYNVFTDLDSLLFTVENMVTAGASFIDVGGEATNPGVNISQEAPSITIEIDRVIPAIQAIKKRFDVLISVDTSQSEVMQAAVDCGADMINDQRALQMGEALKTVVALQVPVCLMHFFTPMRTPESSDFVTLFNTIKNELSQRVQDCLQAGIAQDRLIIDPGFGGGNYGKNTEENFYLLTRLSEFTKLGYPVLSGWSRKSMIGGVLNDAPPKDRLYASIAADTLVALQGAAIIRTHDVVAISDAMKVVNAVLSLRGDFL